MKYIKQTTKKTHTCRVDNIALSITPSFNFSVINSIAWGDFSEWRGDPLLLITLGSKIYEVEASLFKEILQKAFKKYEVMQ